MKVQSRIIFSLGLMMLVSPALMSQTNSASIVGTVTDHSGASISGATVTALRVDTNQKQSTVTNAAGYYNLPFLPVGRYTLSAEYKGFQTVEIAEFTLVVGQTARMDVQMQVGAVTEKVQVEASAVDLQTENASVGAVIGRQQVAELPLNGRSFVQLALLIPGVNPVTPGSLSARSSGGSLGQNVGMNANGNRDYMNRYYYDGIEAMSYGSYSFSFSLSIDAIQEFKVDTSTFSAINGGAPGGQVNLTTKSGTNDIHGTAWEFNRNDKLTALAPFQPYSANAKPPRLNRNQFGANLGGPVILPKLYNGKDKTFFFTNWESGRLVSGSFGATGYVPPVPYRTGDFSSSTAIITDPSTGNPFAGNVIPASRIQSYASKFLGFVPNPNANEPAINFRGPVVAAPINQNQILARIDHRINDKNTIYGTYIFNQQTSVGTPAYTTWDYSGSRGRQQVASLTDTHVFSPSIVNEFRTGWSRKFAHAYFGTTGKPDLDIANIIGIPGVSKDPRNFGPPTFSMGYSYPTISGIGPADNGNQSYQFDDHLSISKGSHFLTIGASIMHRSFTFDEAWQPRGTFGFDGRITSGGAPTTTREHPFAAFLLGLTTNATLSPTAFSNRMSHIWQAYYLQDDWKVTRNLTLNLGMRYEFYGQPLERGKVTDYELNGPTPGFTLSRQIYHGFPDIPDTPDVPATMLYPDYNNWGPRAGFAYRVPGISDLVVRGGYGIYYAQEVSNSYTVLTFNPPIVQNLNYTGTFNSPLSVTSVFLGSGSASNVFNAEAVDPRMRNGLVQQWNFTVQKQLPGQVLFDIGYVGSKGSRLGIAFDGNRPIQVVNPSTPGLAPLGDRRPFKGYSSVRATKSIGTSGYNSLQMKAERRLARNFTFIGSYTLAHSTSLMDQTTVGGGGYSPSIQDVYNLRAENSDSAYDLRHRFSLAAVYNIPLFANSGTVARALLGGWQVNAIVTEQTGFAAAISSYGDTTGTGTASRYNIAAGQNINIDNPSRSKWFNTAAFVAPALGTWGNAPRMPIHLPGLNNIDFAANKNFRIRERFNTQLRFEFFNFFNHVNLGAPGLNPAAPNTFGIVTSSSQGAGATGDQRIIQLGAKFQF